MASPPAFAAFGEVLAEVTSLSLAGVRVRRLAAPVVARAGATEPAPLLARCP